MDAGSRTNWAGNVTFRAADLSRPATVGELQALVAGTDRIRALGTGHSFNDIADSPGAQVSVAGLPPEVEIDSAASVARVAAGLTYAELAVRLDEKGFALRNLASLPHISVAGACATATHGSGLANAGLAAAVTGMEMVAADGELVTVDREDDWYGPVQLGALGVVARATLEVVPSFEVSQRVYEDLPLQVLDEHFADIMASGYSVSMFTDWRAPRLTQVWIKQRAGETSRITEAPWFTATPAQAQRHPVPGGSPDTCTQQLGVPGRWYDRLPHFRPGFRPSAGAELQSEYLLPIASAVPALHAVAEIADRVAPVLQICEIRVVAADRLWLSPCYLQDSVGVHFTWVLDPGSVLPVVTLVERQLAPFGARPHWGKVFTTSQETLREGYPRLPDFLQLMAQRDPAGKFRNAFTDRCLAG
ncbi:MAG: D-arabinono-1,4-lactone oxidase [Streptosporangiaceae bacterium]